MEIKDNFNRQIAQKIFEVRIGQSLNQSKMAAALNVSRAQYSKIEKGTAQPNLNMLKKLSTLYNISMEWLINDSGPMNRGEKPGPEMHNFGEDAKNIDKLLEIMWLVPMVRYAVLRFFFEYSAENRQSIDNALGEYREYRKLAGELP